MAFVRGDRAPYDEWAQSGAPGWSYADLLPFFKRSESTEGRDPAFRDSAVLGRGDLQRAVAQLGDAREGAQAGRDAPVTVFDIEHDPGKLATLAELGVERVLLELPARPEAGSLRELDRRAKLVTSFA